MPSLAVTNIARNTAPQATKMPAQEAAADASPFTQLMNEAASRPDDKSHAQNGDASSTSQAADTKSAKAGDRKIHDGKKDADGKSAASDNKTGHKDDTDSATAPPPQAPAPQPDPNIQVAMAQPGSASQTGGAAAGGPSSDDAVSAMQAASAANASNVAPGDDADDAEASQAAAQPASGNTPKSQTVNPQTGKPNAKSAANAPDAAPSDAEDAFKTLLHGNKDNSAQDSAKQSDAKQADAQPGAADTANASSAPQVPVNAQPASAAPSPPMAAMTANAAPITNNSSNNAAVTTAVHVAPQSAAPNVNVMAVEIAARSQAGAKQFDIRLDPPELGRVEVRLSIDATGKAQAHMTADQPQTLSLLQKDAPALTRALRDAGLDVSQSGLNFSLKGQDRQSNDGGNFQSPARGNSLSLAATKTIEAIPAAASFTSSGNARLDIHV